ncbi:MAG TPA: CBASS oligonucleotide cyclase [Cyclobacteriaceae bacterium]|nr:CBASS oligonucleotide cyclase [Cyclobacteriaceae bacterium]
MENYSNDSTLHLRIRCFVKWIAPEKETRDAIKKQSKEIREKVKGKAEADGLTITAMPYSGSFSKKTGLRRHYRGNTIIEGQDVDIPFVVKKDKESEFEPLIARFDNYVEASYPSTAREKTKSSVRLTFSGTKLSYDVVPMFATIDPEKQMLIRDNGEVITTSIQKHKDFIRSRMKDSSDEEGIVLFNDCIRLLKWWREVKVQEPDSSIEEVPSFLIDLLAAKAYDKLGVTNTYPQTLANWFSYLASLIKKRESIWFNDFYTTPKLDSSHRWSVMDPVMADNNIVKNWSGYQIDELAGWFQQAAEVMNRAMVSDLLGDNPESLSHVKQLFGNIFESHCI